MRSTEAREGVTPSRGLRVFYTIVVGGLLASALAAPPARAAGDPRLEWRTKATEHFRVHYYSGEEGIAERVARIAEDVHRELVPELASDPGHPVDVVITDDSDSANGSATAFPYDLIRLYAVPPDELSPLGEVDDWYRALFTHEYTHILHMVRIGGLPALWNRVVGRTLVPNQWAPRWTLEGVAVLEESLHTSGGRLRSSLWDAQLRADRLGDHPATLDRVTGNPRTWPQGNLWYLYGSYFFRWFERTYGHAALRVLLETHGSELVGYGLERSFRRATGRTLSELWSLFLEEEDARSRAVNQGFVAAGPREGVALTSHGMSALHPRWLPASAHEPERIVYFRSDGHDTSGIVAIPMRGGERTAEPELVARTAGDAMAAREPNGDLVIGATEVSNQVYGFGDLVRVPEGLRDRWGDAPERERLTRGARVDGLDVSPDGRHVVFVTRHRGRSAIVEAELPVRPGEPLGAPRVLVEGEGFDAFYAPRYAPDGARIAYGAWLTAASRERTLGTRGAGARDLFLVDRTTSERRALTRDRAIDGGACFTPDGRYVLFHSDAADGRFEVHAIALADGARFRVTRTPFAAVEPAVSPRGDFLAFSSYDARGWHLRAMPLVPSAFEPIALDPHADDAREPAHAEPPGAPTHDDDYAPLASLRPRAYGLQAGTGTFGTAILATTTGADASGNHRFTLVGRVETDRPELQFDANYAYERLRADLGIRAFRMLSARGGGMNRALYVLPWVQESVGLESSATLPFPTTFASRSATLAASFVRVAGEPASANLPFDPFNRPLVPFEGHIASVRASFDYRRTQAFLHSVGAERGQAFSAGGMVAHELVGSSRSGYSLTAGASQYVPLVDLAAPLQHHTLALHASGGTSDGDYPGPGAFSLGGFSAVPLTTTLQQLLVQGGVALRGYEPFAISGRSFGLANAEYRFPIVNVDRGVALHPVFLKRVTGALFTDVGTAFTALPDATLRGGSGAELWLDTTAGYFADLLFRLGVARGWSEGGVWQTYFVATTVY
jgi:hypothetical protein